MATIADILKKIQDADLTQTGNVDWLGVNGLESIFNEITGLLKDRGVIVAPDLTALSSLGGSDAKLAIIPSLALYIFSPNGTNPPANAVVANGGGVWLECIRSGSGRYQQSVGNGVATSFAINHDLNTNSPEVISMDSSNGLPYLYDTQGTDYTITVTDSNNIVVNYTVALPTSSRIITVKY